MITRTTTTTHFITLLSSKSQCRYYKLSLFTKRFVGNKPIGHAHKVLNALSNKVPTNANGTSATSTFSQSAPTTKIQEIPFTERNLQPISVLTEAEKKGLVTYGASGSYGHAGSPQLTQEGYEIKRVISGSEGLIPQKKQEVKQADKSDIQEVTIGQQPSYHLGTTTISDDTIIPTPAQDHMVVVVKKSDNDDSLEAFAYLTSQKSMNTDVGKIPNTKISDTKVSGQQQPQYAVPLIPPQKVQQGDFKDLEEKTDVFLQNPQTLAALDIIHEETSKYDPIDYKTQGITTEDLNEINQAYDEMNKNKDSTDHTDEFDYKKEEVD